MTIGAEAIVAAVVGLATGIAVQLVAVRTRWQLERQADAAERHAEQSAMLAVLREQLGALREQLGALRSDVGHIVSALDGLPCRRGALCLSPAAQQQPRLAAVQEVMNHGG